MARHTGQFQFMHQGRRPSPGTNLGDIPIIAEQVCQSAFPIPYDVPGSRPLFGQFPVPAAIGPDIGRRRISRRTTGQCHIVLGVEDVQFHGAKIIKISKDLKDFEDFRYLKVFNLR